MKLIAIILIFLMLASGAQAADYPNITFVTGNGTNFTYNSSLIVNTSTTMSLPLVGKGVANLTFYAPNVTSQTNITVGYKSTNATSIQVRWTNATGENNTIYVRTDGTVTNPVIIITTDTALKSSNIPAALIGGGIISMIVVIYAIRRRTR